MHLVLRASTGSRAGRISRGLAASRTVCSHPAECAALPCAPMRVARVIAVLEPGGAQLGALRLSLALSAEGIESRWLAGHATREGLALFRASGVEVELLGGGPALQYARRRAFADRLAAALGGEEVVHAHMFGAWWAAARTLPGGVPLVASEHNALQWPGRAPSRALRDALARVDLFFAHGPAARAEILAAGLPPARMREGSSPISRAAVAPIKGLPSPRIVFAGRLHAEKGPDVLLDALARWSIRRRRSCSAPARWSRSCDGKRRAWASTERSASRAGATAPSDGSPAPRC